MSKSAPYFPFYPEDWLNSQQVFYMDLESEGAYIRLLAAMWTQDGSIPDCPKWCCNLLRCRPAKWKKIRRILVLETKVISAEEGRLFNERLTEEFHRFVTKRTKNSKNSLKRWRNGDGTVKEKDTNEPKKPNEINEGTDAVALQSESYIDLLYTDTESDTETEPKKKKEKRSKSKSKDFCPELQKTGAQDRKKKTTENSPKTASEKSVMDLPLNTGKMFPVTQGQIDDWKNLYQAIDVEQQIRKMRGWLDANPKRRKTSRGILRFVNGWLAKEQDKAGNWGAQSKFAQGSSGNSAAAEESIRRRREKNKPTTIEGDCVRV